MPLLCHKVMPTMPGSSAPLIFLGGRVPGYGGITCTRASCLCGVTNMTEEWHPDQQDLGFGLSIRRRGKRRAAQAADGTCSLQHMHDAAHAATSTCSGPRMQHAAHATGGTCSSSSNSSNTNNNSSSVQQQTATARATASAPCCCLTSRH